MELTIAGYPVKNQEGLPQTFRQSIRQAAYGEPRLRQARRLARRPGAVRDRADKA